MRRMWPDGWEGEHLVNSSGNTLLSVNGTFFSEARRYLPGGVNSPVRAFQAVGGPPVFIRSGKGARIEGENGREFIDYCLCWGALLLGHAHPEVSKALRKAIEKGTSFGAPTAGETGLARLIIEAIPSIERIRLTNSGTEAVMTAIRLARAFTGRDKVIKFEGSYHGHADYLLSCKGVPRDFTRHTLSAPYNNLRKVSKIVERHGSSIAAIIVEPVAANMGVVLPSDGFLQGLREISREQNILLIFDEVITGFRLTYGGAQDYFDVKPDLTCLGKIIGGGLPIGAVGGKKEVMELLAPEGQVYQAGTFSGNPLSVSAGLATLKKLGREDPYPRLYALTRHLSERIEQAAQKSGCAVRVNCIGPLFSIFFTDREVIDYHTAKTQDEGAFKVFYHGLLREGIYLSPSGFEANFLSTAHTAGDIEKTGQAIEKALKSRSFRTVKIARGEKTNSRGETQ